MSAAFARASVRAAGGRAFGLTVVIAFTLACTASADKVDIKAATDAIRQQITNYTAALDRADIGLASQVWRTSPEVSFIHPAGHARGWEEVKEIYKFFGSSFSERKLAVRDVSVHVNGETAWAEFYWHFAAKQSKDGSAVQTNGRETQIYHKAGNHWGNWFTCTIPAPQWRRNNRYDDLFLGAVFFWPALAFFFLATGLRFDAAGAGRPLTS